MHEVYLVYEQEQIERKVMLVADVCGRMLIEQERMLTYADRVGAHADVC